MGTTLVSGNPEIVHFEVVRIPLYRPLLWAYRGWLDLRKHWGASLGYGALVVALGWTLLIFCATHPYFIAAAISGFLLVGPVIAAGLCEMSRRYSLGQAASFDDSLEGFTRDSSGLFEFGAILAGCAVLWFGISAVLLGSVFHIAAPDVRESWYQGFFDSANRSQVIA